MKWGSTDRPADQPQDGAVRDAARPGSYVGNVLGSCAREAASQLAMADRRVVKLRPVPQEPWRRREEPASVQGALRPGCPGFRIGIGGAVLDPSTDSRSGKALIPVERRRESRARSVRPLRVGDGPSRFLGTKRWKKPETASIIARTSDRREGPGRGNRPPTPKLLAPT